MSLEQIESELAQAGLHQESVERLIEHYEQMRFHLSNEDYTEAGAHVGNFCESLANVILAETDQGPQDNVSVGTFVDEITSSKYDVSDLEKELRLTVPRAIRTAYDIRNDRDSVHMNLKIPVNHSDTQAAVRLCTWMLAELVRVYGERDNIDEIAALIEDLAAPQTPYISSLNGKRLVMSTDLELNEELLVHLYTLGTGVEADRLDEWIPGADSHSIKSTLGRMKQSRTVHYDDGTAKITPLGAQRAEEIVSEHFDGQLESRTGDVER